MLADPATLVALVALLALTAYAAIIDLRSMRIPDQTNAAIFLTGLLASVTLNVVDPILALAGAAIGGGCLLAVRQAFRVWRGYDGLGLGDVKFVAATATWVGVEGLSLALLIGCLSALVFLAIGRVSGKVRFSRRHRIPFGPFLALGADTIAGAQLLMGRSIGALLEDLLLIGAT